VALADTAKLVAQLTLQDQFSKPLKAAEGQLGSFEGRMNSLQRSGVQIGHGIRQVGSGLTTLGVRAGVVAAGGLTAVVKTAIDFESAFAGVAKTVEATPAELEKLEQGFLNLSKTIPLSVEELEGIGEQAGALGIAKDDILAFTEVVAKIGATTDVSSDQAATALGQLQNVLGLTADEFDNFGAALVDLGNKGASTESQILEIASRAGAGAALIGVAKDATLGWSSAVANLGVQTEAGGSALQTFFLQAQKNVSLTDRLKIMADTAGVTGSAFKKAFKEDAGGALQDFLIGLGKLPKAAQLQVLDDLNLKGIRLQRVLLGLAGNTDNLTTSLDNASEAWDKNAALNEEFAKRAATTESALRVVVNNVRIAANTIGAELLPVIRDLSAEFVDFLNKPGTQRQIKEFATGLADGVRGFVQEFKSGGFDDAIDTLKQAAGVMKTAFDAFNALPGPLKSALIAGAVVNRATGGALGLITSGLLNIGKGLGGLLTRGNSPAAPLFVKDVGIPGGGTGVGPGVGGGLGRFGAALGLLGFVGFAVTAANALKDLEESIDGVGFAASKTGHGLLDNLFGPPQNPSTPQGQFNPANQGGTVPVNVKKLPPAAFKATELAIKQTEKGINTAIRKGDVLAAARAQRQLMTLHRLNGTLDTRTNRIAIRIGEVNQGLSKANRNLDEGNREQRETARRIDAARERIGTGFQRMNDQQGTTNSQLNTIAGKDFSPNVNVNVPVTTQVSINDVIRSVTHADFRSGFTPGLLNG
jgi:TP901 family phage tail tape measure protein